MKATTRFRQTLNSGAMVVTPFVLNAFHAKIAEAAGFEAVYMTGSGTAAERGFPDVGLITMTEMVQNARYIAGAVSVPVICDADTGYGNPINVWRAVREYEDAGVAAIHIEDQVFPKKCGFFEGKDVIPQEEMVQKIRAALDARTDPDFTIIARTDAYAVTGWEDAVKRCRAYSDAGAHMVFVDGIKTVDDLHTYADDLKELPRMYNGDQLAHRGGGQAGVQAHDLRQYHMDGLQSRQRRLRGAKGHWEGGPVTLRGPYGRGQRFGTGTYLRIGTPVRDIQSTS